eukprot:4044080-Alexandrium_andersonii.AAC.1
MHCLSRHAHPSAAFVIGDAVLRTWEHECAGPLHIEDNTSPPQADGKPARHLLPWSPLRRLAPLLLPLLAASAVGPADL